MGWTRKVILTKWRSQQRGISKEKGKTRLNKEEKATSEVKQEERSGHKRMSK